MKKPTSLWTPSAKQIADSSMTRFTNFVKDKIGVHFSNYGALHQWSCESGAEFWDVLWDFAGVVGNKGEQVVEHEDKMPGAIYFPQAQLNYAENLLKYRGDQEAIVFQCEDKIKRSMSRDQLYDMVSRIQQALKEAGVEKGDRVAAMMPNMPETVAAMLATASMGAVWSSCSPDFGTKGVLDRFGQVEPKIFITCDGYWYNGKRIEILDKLKEITPELNTVKTIIVPLLGEAESVADALEGVVTFDQFLEGFNAGNISFERVSFSHPLYIMFSSGTTGVPKCIVHSHGGTLMKLTSEHLINIGVKENDRVFYFTTCGWMMWNWLVNGLSCGATLMLYDGSPFYPNERVLFDYAEREKFMLLGMSAKFIDAVRNSGLRPIESHDLSSVRVIGSTGSPLAPENFDFVYSGIKQDTHLASMSGGTDIMGCFVMGVPWKPVYKGEIQGPALGMDVQVWDDDGKAMHEGKGELVCAHAFPSMPIGFWGDESGEKYHNAYFAQFNNVWCHGDFAEMTDTGGIIIHGRSDATLNPGGVRIGTAEIYNQVEQMDEVEEGLCIGQEWQSDARVVLFVRLKQGEVLNEALEADIKKRIRTGASPRHVPAKIIQVDDIPRTKSGKITELAVRDVVHGRKVKNKEALENPDALALFENLEALKT